MEFWKTEIAAAGDAPPFWRRPHPSIFGPNGASVSGTKSCFAYISSKTNPQFLILAQRVPGQNMVFAWYLYRSFRVKSLSEIWRVS